MTSFFLGVRFINCFRRVCRERTWVFLAFFVQSIHGESVTNTLFETLVFHWKLSLSYFLHKKQKTFYFSHYDYHDKLFQFILIWSWPTFFLSFTLAIGERLHSCQWQQKNPKWICSMHYRKLDLRLFVMYASLCSLFFLALSFSLIHSAIGLGFWLFAVRISSVLSIYI